MSGSSVLRVTGVTMVGKLMMVRILDDLRIENFNSTDKKTNVVLF